MRRHQARNAFTLQEKSSCSLRLNVLAVMLSCAECDAGVPSTKELLSSVESSPFFHLLSILLIAALVVAGLVKLGKTAKETIQRIICDLQPYTLIPTPSPKILRKALAEETPSTVFEFARIGKVAPASEGTIVDPSEEQSDPLKEFFGWVPAHLVQLRHLHQTISRTAADGGLEEKLSDLRSQIAALRIRVSQPELAPVRQMAAALEGLVKQLGNDVRDVTPSTLRTVAGGIDLLADLCTPDLNPNLATHPPIHILAVDDDPIGRIAVTCSIKKSFEQPDLAEDGASALALAAEQAYDVIFLDVQMPGMDGFELCAKIHETAVNRTTPVVFVTGMKDFTARAKSISSGGSDLIGKPFLSFEVAVKALTLALRRRLAAGRPMAQAAPAPVVSKTPPPNPSAPPLAAVPTMKPVAIETRGKKPVELIDKEVRELQRQLRALHLEMDELTRELDPEEFRPAFQMASAIQALFRKLEEHPKNVTASTLFTAISAMELLKELCFPGVDPLLALTPAISILVVDDEPIARRAMVGTLQTAFLKPDSADGGEAALALVAEKRFDVIFLDVQMPGLDGFSVCGKIRETTLNRDTPVVFVTSHTGLETRTQSVACGGSDFVAKPILFVEITVKALNYALRGRLQNTAGKRQELAAIAN